MSKEYAQLDNNRVFVRIHFQLIFIKNHRTIKERVFICTETVFSYYKCDNGYKHPPVSDGSSFVKD